MNKAEYLAALRTELEKLQIDDIEERLLFYSEMIDDRTDDGLSEAEAIEDVGTVDDAVSQIISEIPLSKLVKEKVKPRRPLRIWETILLVLGSPIWLSLLLCAFAVALSIYVVLWAVIVSLWAVFASLAAAALGSVAAAIAMICCGETYSGLFVIGAGLVCGGLSIFMFFGCRAATKGVLILTKKATRWIKNCFVRKERA